MNSSHFSRVALGALALLFVAASSSPARAVEAACATDLDYQVLALVNAQRAALGRAPLEIDVRLTAAALRHTEDMRDHCFLSHTGSDGSTPKQRMTEAGYPNPMGEVAATGSSLSPATVVGAWMNSSDHRSILMNENARHLGLGYAARSTRCNAFWVGDTGGAPDSEFLDGACCSDSGGTPICTVDECQNGVDDDGDGVVDFPADPGCAGAGDLDEHSPTLSCDDGVDNDGDGFTDFPGDPVCQTASSIRENAQCQDGIDNDNDGKIDFDGGASVNGGVPVAPADSAQCNRPSNDSEAPDCGLGAELALVMPLLGLAARRTRRAR